MRLPYGFPKMSENLEGGGMYPLITSLCELQLSNPPIEIVENLFLKTKMAKILVLIMLAGRAKRPWGHEQIIIALIARLIIKSRYNATPPPPGIETWDLLFILAKPTSTSWLKFDLSPPILRVRNSGLGWSPEYQCYGFKPWKLSWVTDYWPPSHSYTFLILRQRIT